MAPAAELVTQLGTRTGPTPLCRIDLLGGFVAGRIGGNDGFTPSAGC